MKRVLSQSASKQHAIQREGFSAAASAEHFMLLFLGIIDNLGKSMSPRNTHISVPDMQISNCKSEIKTSSSKNATSQTGGKLSSSQMAGV